VGVVGVAGPYTPTHALAAALLVQLAVLHSPGELQLAIVSADDDLFWDWTTLLPHYVSIAAEGLPAPGTNHTDSEGQPALVVLLDGAGALRRHPWTAGLLAQTWGNRCLRHLS
jgi:S-DNA-T family DNA segregation ATPase FtsK/SpoIIIE